MAETTHHRRLLRQVTLFGVAMLMVLGFYLHEGFYSLGLPLLLAIGATAVFVVLRAIAWSLGPDRAKPQTTGVLLFPKGLVDGIRHGTVTTTLRPLRESPMRAGDVFGARVLLTETSFALVRIVEIRRSRLGGMTAADARQCGFGEEAALLDVWTRTRGRNDPNEIVRLIRFEVIG